MSEKTRPEGAETRPAPGAARGLYHAARRHGSESSAAEL